ncbi:MAG: neutral zinc metallopeptidase [Planctomycetaceae bacterium]
MRWRGRERSENVDDRRGMSPRMALGGGGGMLAILIMLALKFFGAPPAVQQMAGQAVNRMQQNQAQNAPAGEGIDDDYREFTQVVLRDTERVWEQLFEEIQDSRGRAVPYTPPRLVMFSGQEQTACGLGQAAMGPFYCPADQMVYIDPTFFEDLANRHNAPGDFAQAYVIAHEVAHHVQSLLGFSTIVNQVRAQGDEIMSNQYSVRLELQADFLAGVWAHHAHKEYNILEEGDMEEAITAANQIGDDTLQKQSTGRVIPERFTHGTSAQRVFWFRKGLLSGNLKDAETLFQVDYEDL